MSARVTSRLPAPALAALLLAVAATLVAPAGADKGANDGTFEDRDGKQHRWSVERSHLLVWDDRPYVPCGVVFASAFLKAPSAETFRTDEAELDRLRSAGIADIWIDPQRGLLENSPADIQKLLDAVEARGFRYGLRVGDRHREPLVGFEPGTRPIRVPAQRLQPETTQEWEIEAPRGRRTVYVLAETNLSDERIHNWAVATDEALVENEKARLRVRIPKTSLLGKSRGLLLTATEIQVEPEDLGSFGDLWAGMEAYAARLQAALRKLRFGPGFRFLLDPFVAGDGSVGQEDSVFPSSASFRAAFQEWLQRRWGIHTLNTRWRTNDRRIPGHAEAARLIPLWPRNDPPEGDGWLVDPIDRVAYRCQPRDSTIWEDLDAFRSETLRRWMNTLATTVKREIVDVPVLFSWAAYHPLFSNTPSPSGYDGLAAQLHGNPADIARETAAYAFAQAEEADRNTWLIAVRLAGPSDSSGTPAPIADLAQLRRAWDGMREVGFRGLYLDPARVPNAAALARELAAGIAASETDLRRRTPVCFFPMTLATADRITRLSNGVWWLPAARPTRLLRYGDFIVGYEIEQPLGSDHPIPAGIVLWSTRGRQEVTFFSDRLALVQFYDSSGAPIKVRRKKDQVQVVLSEEPIVATGAEGSMIFPVELATYELQEFARLIDRAEQEGVNTASLKVLYQQARRNLTPASAAAIYQSVRPYVSRLRDALSPYVWLEGERPLAHRFNGLAFQAGCSGGLYLRLDRGSPPASGLYTARYAVTLVRDAAYEIWIAGKVPGRPGVSPLVWQIDDEPAEVLSEATPAGSDYALGFGWFRLGRVTLRAGRHELLLAVPEKAAGTSGRFVAAIDVVVFSREPFRPEGIEKPLAPSARSGRSEKER